jgi:hypothetical protein
MHHLQLGVQARHGLVAQGNAAPFSSPPHHTDGNGDA